MKMVTLVHVGTHGDIAFYALPGSPKILGYATYDPSKCEPMSWIHMCGPVPESINPTDSDLLDRG